MSLLEQWGYPVVSLQALANDFDLLPDNATAITIDDGWYGTYKHMLPVLEKHGYPATIYLTTYYCLNNKPVANVALQYCFQNMDSLQVQVLDLPAWQLGPLSLTSEEDCNRALQLSLERLEELTDNAEKQTFLLAVANAIGIDISTIVAERWFHLMNPDEVADAARRGMSFELHTHRHRIAEGATSCLTEEINTNREYIHSLTGQNAHHFCYPSGVYHKDVWPELQRCGVQSATTTEVGLVDEQSELFAWPRILDGQYISDLEFEAEMSGFLELTRRFRRLFGFFRAS